MYPDGGADQHDLFFFYQFMQIDRKWNITHILNTQIIFQAIHMNVIRWLGLFGCVYPSFSSWGYLSEEDL